MTINREQTEQRRQTSGEFYVLNPETGVYLHLGNVDQATLECERPTLGRALGVARSLAIQRARLHTVEVVDASFVDLNDDERGDR